jgi:hypothetical protein
MKVVTSAIRTIIVNTCGVITPRSRPRLSTISSISPRVFINNPSAEASRHDRPTQRPAATLPPNLPSVAVRMITRHTSQSAGDETSPTEVRMPVKAKKTGRSSTTTMSPRLARSCSESRASWGISAPKKNAPKSAWMPIDSVAKAESRSSTKVPAIAVRRGGPPSFSSREISQRISGRTKSSIAAT